MWFNKCVPLIVAICLTTSCSARVRNPVVNQVLEEIKALIANHALTINPVVSKLNHIDNQMQLMSSKFDRLFEANELIKTNERLIMDKISGIDVRLSAIDHSIRTELTVGQNASMTHQSSNFDRMEQNLDSKIRKVLNVASNSYEETKSIRTGLEQSELISSSQSARSFIPLRDPSSGHETQEMVRGLREQLTIHNYDVTRKVTTLEETAIKLTAYLNAIEEHQIILNDNFVTFSESLTESLKRPPDNPDTKGTSDKVPGNVTLWQSEFEAKLDKKLDAILNKFAKMTKCSKSVQMLELPAITVNSTSALGRQPPKMQSTQSVAPAGIRATPHEPGAPCNSVPKVMTSSSCSELYTLGGATCDGVYILFLNTRAFRAYCNMADTPGGWTVILRRGQFRANQRHRVSFDQPWDSYKAGFGDVGGEFYLGNELVHTLTSSSRTTLRVELESFDGDYLQLDYQLFRVDSEQNGYRLTVGDYRGPTEHAPVASSLINHNGSQFSATDKNLSYNVLENCPRTHRAGFWFEKLRCTYVLLTGTYYDEKELPPDGAHLGIRWVSWKNNEPLKAVQLKITTRP